MLGPRQPALPVEFFEISMLGPANLHCSVEIGVPFCVSPHPNAIIVS